MIRSYLRSGSADSWYTENPGGALHGKPGPSLSHSAVQHIFGRFFGTPARMNATVTINQSSQCLRMVNVCLISLFASSAALETKSIHESSRKQPQHHRRSAICKTDKTRHLLGQASGLVSRITPMQGTSCSFVKSLKICCFMNPELESRWAAYE